jgi:hypothetical protein
MNYNLILAAAFPMLALPLPEASAMPLPAGTANDVATAANAEAQVILAGTTYIVCNDHKVKGERPPRK